MAVIPPVPSRGAKAANFQNARGCSKVKIKCASELYAYATLFKQVANYATSSSEKSSSVTHCDLKRQFEFVCQ